MPRRGPRDYATWRLYRQVYMCIDREKELREYLDRVAEKYKRLSAVVPGSAKQAFTMWPLWVIKGVIDICGVEKNGKPAIPYSAAVYILTDIIQKSIGEERRVSYNWAHMRVKRLVASGYAEVIEEAGEEYLALTERAMAYIEFIETVACFDAVRRCGRGGGDG